jgi:hypothetical protein
MFFKSKIVLKNDQPFLHLPCCCSGIAAPEGGIGGDDNVDMGISVGLDSVLGTAKRFLMAPICATTFVIPEDIFSSPRYLEVLKLRYLKSLVAKCIESVVYWNSWHEVHLLLNLERSTLLWF